MVKTGIGGFGCFLLVLVFNVVIGGYCLNYVMATVFGKTMSLLMAGLISLVLGEFTVPAALICFVLRAFGVHTPLVH